MFVSKVIVWLLDDNMKFKIHRKGTVRAKPGTKASPFDD